MIRRSRKKWRERLHLDGKVISSLSVLMVAVIMVFVMVTSVNCGDDNINSEGIPSNPVASMQQIPSQINSALSPQNYVTGGSQPTFFPGQQSLLSGPANFFPGAQNFMSAPSNLFQVPGAQNFMSNPSTFAQGAQSLMQAPSSFMPSQSFMSGDNPLFSGPAKMLAASPTTLASGANQSPASLLNLFQNPASMMGTQTKTASNNKEIGIEEHKDDPSVQYISVGHDQKTKHQSQALRYDHNTDFSDYKQTPPSNLANDTNPTMPPLPTNPTMPPAITNPTMPTGVPTNPTMPTGVPTMPSSTAAPPTATQETPPPAEDKDNSKTTAKPENVQSATIKVIGG